MTTDTETSPAFATCEALFDAHPKAVTDEGDSGQVMPIDAAGQRFRLVRHDTAAGRFYRIYQPDDEQAILTISPVSELTEATMRELRGAVPVFPAVTEQPNDRTSGPVHAKFGLTYANFLVIHRAKLQSMPLDWQARFVDLLEDLDAAYPDHDDNLCFEVTTVTDSYVGELDGEQMQALGITRDEEDGETRWTDKAGCELGPHNHVGIPVPDPIPHYKHAYLPPDEAAIAARHQAKIV